MVRRRVDAAAAPKIMHHMVPANVICVTIFVHSVGLAAMSDSRQHTGAAADTVES